MSPSRQRWAEQVAAHVAAHGTPLVTLKIAASLDGRIAVASGDSRWVTGERARREGHRERARHDAIGVGAATALADDPALTVRLVRGADPRPVVFDPALRTATAGALQCLRPGAIVLYTRARAASPGKLLAALRERGVEPVAVRSRAGQLDLHAALAALAARGVRSLLVDGGGRLLGGFLAARAWQRLLWFSAPRVLGEGPAAVAGVTWPAIAAAPAMVVVRARQLGEDRLFELAPRG